MVMDLFMAEPENSKEILEKETGTPKKAGRPKGSKTKRRKRSQKKSVMAILRPRDENGHFLPMDKENYQVRKAQAAALILKEGEEGFKQLANLNPTIEIKAAEREYIGTDSRKFLEKALENASTWFEGFKYAKELKNLQYPSLAPVKDTGSKETTQIKFVWGGLEGEPQNPNNKIFLQDDED